MRGTVPVVLAALIVSIPGYAQHVSFEASSMLEALRTNYPSEQLGKLPANSDYAADCTPIEGLPDSLVLISGGKHDADHMLDSWEPSQLEGRPPEWSRVLLPLRSLRNSAPPDTLRAKVMGTICPGVSPEIALEREGIVFGLYPSSLLAVYDQGEPNEFQNPWVYVVRGGRLVPAVYHEFTASDATPTVADLETYHAERTKLRNASASARRARIRAKGWSREITDLVIAGKIKIGMTAEMVRLAWGKPSRINTTSTATTEDEQWVYGSSGYVYLTNGVVRAIQTSR